MKLLIAFISVLFLYGCSFDNKSGIWKNVNSVKDDKGGTFDDFQKLSTSQESFDKVIKINPKFKILLTEPTTNYKWNDIFFNQSNNLSNFNYGQLNTKFFISKKLSKHKTNNHILSINKNLITTDEKGNIISYSIENNRLLNKYNFYKKKIKKIKKNLNIYVENSIVYVSDNIGYLYAYDFYKNKIVWAKNYKIPFRGNIKLYNNKLIATNQNNNLFFF